MYEIQYLILVAIAIGSTYLSFFDFEYHVELTLLVSLATWSMLIPASGNLVVVSDGQTMTMGSQLFQALSLFLALLSGFALAGAIFGHYPTEDMEEATNATKSTEH